MAKTGSEKYLSIKLLMLCGVAMGGAFPALAQDAGESDALADIVVTAQKREQSLQDVGLSVTALGTAALEAMGRQDVTALAGQVPSLQVNQFAPTVTIFNVRGVSQNDFGDSQEAPIAFYNDEVYVGSLGAISGQTFDLERVEVLRGPQGTLFGRNATGGLVQIVTAKPTDTFEGFATLTVGSYGQIATEAAISGPVTDRIRARVSLTSNHHSGYIKNFYVDETTGRKGQNQGNARFFGARAQIEADVGSEGRLLVKLQRLRNDHESSGGIYSHIPVGLDADGLGIPLPGGTDAFGYAETDDDPFTANFDHPGGFDRTYWSATARYEQKFGEVDLVSITDYQSMDKSYSEDADMGPLPGFVYYTAQDMYQLSQELRLSGEAGKLKWLVGGYGFKLRSDVDYEVDLSALVGVNDQYNGRQNTESLAAFGQLEYEVSPQLNLILGARYSWDWKNIRLSYFQQGDFADPTAVYEEDYGPATHPFLKQKFDNYSFKAEVDYKPVDDVLLYASVNRGTKSGGFGIQSFMPIVAEAMPFDEEVLTSYEAGFKLTLLDRRLTLNGAGFYYDYNDYQAFSTIGLSQFITNNTAEVKGFEVEMTARPTRGLTLNAFLTHLDTKVEGITLPGSGRVVDRKMPQAPAWSIGGGARYAVQIGAGEFAAQTDWKYDSSQYFSTFNSPVDREKSHLVGNARLSYKPDGDHLEVAVFVNNLTDKKYRVYNLDLGLAIGSAQSTYARPRWWGGSLSYNF